ncbi:MAG: hypothetical protein GTO24_21025 [candidate division Zixibacteria bacterium]|nr:hypothetical protein [candidate division Zixibacteria bacterium]
MEKEEVLVDHPPFREDDVRISTRKDGARKVEHLSLSLGSYTGSECLSLRLGLDTYHKTSQRYHEKSGYISVHYSDLETLERIRDVVDQAIADAREWAERQEDGNEKHQS